MSCQTVLYSKISNTELLNLYGYEPLPDGGTVRSRWDELSSNWTRTNSPELGELRQTMLQIHLECCPDDERWVKNDTEGAYNKLKDIHKSGGKPTLLEVQTAIADYLKIRAERKMIK